MRPNGFSSRLRRVTLTGLLIIAGLCVALVLAELGTRWLYPVLRGSNGTWSNIDRRLDQADVILELARGNQAAAPEVLESAIPHPYLGYVMDSNAELPAGIGLVRSFLGSLGSRHRMFMSKARPTGTSAWFRPLFSHA